MLGRPGLWAVPDHRLRRDIDIARPDERPLLGADSAEDGVVQGDRLEDRPSKEIGQVTLHH